MEPVQLSRSGGPAVLIALAVVLTACSSPHHKAISAAAGGSVMTSANAGSTSPAGVAPSVASLDAASPSMPATSSPPSTTLATPTSRPAATHSATTHSATATARPTSSDTAKPTPTVKPTVVAGSGSLAGKVIVLDPGHNLNNSSSINQLINAGNGVTKACDTVGTSTNGGYPEHAFTWDVANRAAALLRREGATVILTRSSDTGIGPCVPARAQIGNDAHADAFIAIHADGGPSSGHGFFVMQPPPNNPNVNPGGAAQSRVLAKTMHDVFHATTGIPYSSYITNGYYPDSTTTGTINLSHGPVITIECLDMRNASDAAIATNAAWRQKIAAGIAAGLTAFLTS